MTNALQVLLATLNEQIGVAAFSDDSKRVASWCCGQLPPLYAKLIQTNESRYFDKIKGVVQTLVQELGKNRGVCPEAPVSGADIVGRFQLLHEQFGLPRLEVKMPGTARKATRSAAKKTSSSKA